MEEGESQKQEIARYGRYVCEVTYNGNESRMARELGLSQSKLNRLLSLKTKSLDPYLELKSLLPEAPPTRDVNKPPPASGIIQQADRADRYVDVRVIVASAGDGAEPERHEEMAVPARQFRRDFRKSPPANGEADAWYVRIEGESMAPEFFDGDELPIERLENGLGTAPTSGVYVVLYDGRVHVRRLDFQPGQRWQIRFYDGSRSPKEKAVYLDAEAYSRQQIKAKRDELYYLYSEGEWDPWRDEGLPGERQALTVQAAATAYVDAKKEAGMRGEEGGWSRASEKSKSYVIDGFVRSAGPNKRVDDLRTADVRRYLQGGGLAPSTQKGYRRILRAMARWWLAEGYIEEELAMPPQKKVVQELPDYVTEDELELLCAKHLELQQDKRDKKHSSTKRTGRDYLVDVFRFAFYQGLRLGELYELRVGDVDLEAGELRVETSKANRVDVIPLVPPARPIAEKWARKADPDGSGEDRLFQRKAAYYASRAWKAAVTAAVEDEELAFDKPGVHFHSLRHSCAVYWRRRGVALEDLRDLLRHSTVRVTEKYEQIVATDLGARFESAFEGGAG